MHETNDAPAWVRTLARGTIAPEFPRIHEPAFARGSMPRVPAVTEQVRVVRKRVPVDRWLVLASLFAVAVTVTVVGARMWRHARGKPLAMPSAALAIGDGRLELSADRRSLVRLGQGSTRWTSPQPAAIDSLEVTGPVVLARANGGLSAIDLASGSRRFGWMLPAGETWGVQQPVVLGSCLTAVTVRGEDAVVRCLDVATGAARWT